MPDPGQFELQLGHLCNNRCVFCYSGQVTHLGEAPLVPAGTLRRELRQARAGGARRVTLLGGEPTIQPAFLEVVAEAVALGFDEIVIFSNGSAPARGDLIDRVLATGGRFEWRLSFQGATREAHERTTGRRGSFDRLLRTAAALRERGQRVTVNMCVVATNHASLPALGGLMERVGASQVHVDMLNPYDTGLLLDHEVRALQPRYRDLAAPLAAMVAGFPDGFDLNIGNLPCCVAPALAPWVHHGGQPTWTRTAETLSDPGPPPPRNKYLHKGDRKAKPAACASCLLDDRCPGVFEAYLRWHGPDEFVPLTAGRLAALDPGRSLLALHLRPALTAALARSPLPAPFARARLDERDLRSVGVHMESPDGATRLDLDLVRDRGGAAATAACAVRVASSRGEPGALLGALSWLVASLAAGGAPAVHPPGPDAFVPLPASVAARLARLRAAAPFGQLTWTSTALAGPAGGVEVALRSPSGEEATVWLDERAGRPVGGYRVSAEVTAAPSPELRQGLGEVMAALGRR